MGHRLLPGKPELYHGRESSRPYFEGWYFKQVLPDGSFSLALIPGIYKSKDKSSDHCFIQVLHDNKSRYIKFPVDEFRFKRDEFDISIGKNSFSMNGVSIDISEDDFSIKAELSFKDTVGLDRNFMSPSIMGPFSYFPGMQCNHGVLSLHHNLEGWIEINGRRHEASDMAGYIEKDWGEAFPSSWLWLQGNGLKESEPFSCMCSVATIPYGPLHFRGFLAVILAKGKQYRFTTYNKARIREFTVDKNKTTIVITRKGLGLTVEADTHRSSILKAPAATGMDRNILESLDAVIKMTLTDENGVIFSGECNSGGLETSETGEVSDN